MGRGAGAGVSTEPISREELDKAIKLAARGKAPGLDGIPMELWAEIGEGEGRR